MQETRLIFKSRYLNASHYLVVGGPMHDKRIKVVDSDLAELERLWGGGGGWNLTRAEFERDILGAAGMVVHLHSPVTSDVMVALKGMALENLEEAERFAAKHDIDGMDAAYFESRRKEIEARETGYWRNGWHRTPPADAKPVVAEQSA